MIIKKLTMTKGATETEMLALTTYLDGLGKFVGSDLVNGRFVITAKFEDEMDATAFSLFVAQQLAEKEGKG